MQLNNVEYNVLVKGKAITQYQHNGNIFIEGRAGSNFEIEVINRNPFRIEAVISVDGRSITDGQLAGVHSTGYLVEANSTLRVPGWKVNDGTVAAFEFTGKEGSYSTVMSGGDSRNNGVIGVMAFKDRSYRPAPIARNFGAAIMGGAAVMGGATVMPYGAPGGGSPLIGAALGGAASLDSGWDLAADAAPPRAMLSGGAASMNSVATSRVMKKAIAQPEPESMNNLGTGFGAAKEFATTQVAFERGDLQAMMVIYYDNARGLKARGIEVGRPSRTRHTATQPQAFPAMHCPTPPGWQG